MFVFWFQNESQGSESTELGPHIIEPHRGVLLTSQASSRLELITKQAPPHPLSTLKEKLVTLQMLRPRPGAMWCKKEAEAKEAEQTPRAERPGGKNLKAKEAKSGESGHACSF